MSMDYYDGPPRDCNNCKHVREQGLDVICNLKARLTRNNYYPIDEKYRCDPCKDFEEGLERKVERLLK